MAGQQPQKPPLQGQVDQIVAKINEHAGALEMAILRDGQFQQVIDQYRSSIYNLELKNDLLIKMLEEKGIMAKEEFGKRWPLYLKNDVGIIGPQGKMDGEMKVTFYGEN